MATFGPFNVTPTLRPTQGGGGGGANVPTQEEIRQLREYIDSLQKGEGEGYGGRYTWANALADTVSGGVKGYERSKLASKAQEGAKYEEGKWDKLYQGQQSLQEQIGRALSGGGTAQGVPPESPLPKGLPEGALAMLDPAASPDSGSPPASSPLGLTTREPPSQQTLASAGPSTQIGRLLDTGGPPASAAEALLSPRSRLAQAQPSNALTRSPKDWNDLLGQSYFGMGGAYARRGYQPAEQALMADRARKGVEGVMPQYQVGPHGEIMTQQPGRVPYIGGTMSGHPGVVKPGPGGIEVQERVDPRTGNIKQDFVLPRVPGAPTAAPSAGRRGEATPVTPAPTTAPAAPTGAPGGGMLTNAAPAAKLAFAGDPKELWNDIAQGTPATPEQEEAAKQLPSNNPPEKVWKKYIDESKPQPLPSRESMGAPNVLEQAQKGDIFGLTMSKADTEAYGKVRAAALEERYKKGQENLEAIDTAGSQADKLAAQLKMGVQLAKDGNIPFGPFSGAETLFRGAREQLGNIAERNGLDKAAKFFKEGNTPATDAQAYTKIISGTVLESLRSMLGKNAGQFRVFELQLLKDAFGNPNLTHEANVLVMGMIDKINDRTSLMQSMAHSYVDKHGALDEGFTSAFKKFEKENPVFLPDEGKKLHAAMTKVGEPEKATPAAKPASPTRLKPGDIPGLDIK